MEDKSSESNGNSDYFPYINIPTNYFPSYNEIDKSVTSFFNYICEGTANLSSYLHWGEPSPPYYLNEEWQSIKDEIEAKKSSNSGLGEIEVYSEEIDRDVIDTTMYDILQIPTNSTKSQIKAAYRKLAFKYHPDKNKTDENSKIKFQEISKAYQILIDDESRKAYDSRGLEATESINIIDPCLFFMMFFGCEDLEEFIGTTKVATFIQMSNIKNKRLHMSMVNDMTLNQKLREVELAIKLRNLLSGANKKDWAASNVERIRKKSQSTFGDVLIESIGWVYENTANTYIAEMTTFLGIGSTLSYLESTGRSIGNGWSVFKSMASVVKIASSATENKDGESAEDKLNTVKDIINNALSLIVYDVESTVYNAAYKALRDESGDAKSTEFRLKRAESLRILGLTMQKIAVDVRKQRGGVQPDIVKEMHDTFLKVLKRKETKSNKNSA